MNNLNTFIRIIRNLIPYLSIVIIYFLLINLEANNNINKNQTNNGIDKSREELNIDDSSKTINDVNTQRVRIPVIPYKDEN